MVKRKYRCVMGCANGIGRVCLFIEFVVVYREGNKHTFISRCSFLERWGYGGRFLGGLDAVDMFGFVVIMVVLRGESSGLGLRGTGVEGIFPVSRLNLL